jgi:hypothetical protein
MGLNTLYKTESVLYTDGFSCDLCNSYINFAHKVPVAQEGKHDHIKSMPNCVQIQHTFGYGSDRDGESVSLFMCECCKEKLCKEKNIPFR